MVLIKATALRGLVNVPLEASEQMQTLTKSRLKSLHSGQRKYEEFVE